MEIIRIEEKTGKTGVVKVITITEEAKKKIEKTASGYPGLDDRRAFLKGILQQILDTMQPNTRTLIVLEGAGALGEILTGFLISTLTHATKVNAALKLWCSEDALKDLTGKKLNTVLDIAKAGMGVEDVIKTC